MDLYPSPSRSWFCSLNLAFYISFPLSFPLSPSPSSGTVPLLPTLSFYRPVALDFRSSFSLSQPTLGRPRSARIPTVVGTSLYGCLFLPARYTMFRLPNTDPSRTNDRTTTPFSSPVAHTINHFYLSLSLSFLSEKPRATEGCTLCQGLSGSLPLPPPRSYPILRPRPDQPSLSEIFRRSRACTSLHLTPWSSPRPRKCAGQSRAHVRHFHSCHSSRIRPGRDGRGGKSLYHTREQTGCSKKRVLLPFFPL